MTWGIVFIILAIAMAIGPIMMFRPTSHMRHLEALRANAAKSGLKIRTTNYESRNQKHSVVVYSLPCETPFDVSTLQRLDISHDVHFYQQWDWQNKQNPPLSEHQNQRLKAFISALPETVIGIEFSPDSVGLWWQESSIKQWGMLELKSALAELKQIIIE